MKTIALFLLIVIHGCNMAQPRQKKFLALGDSYTIGESVSPAERWPVQLQRALNNAGQTVADPVIIATTGWRTDDLERAIVEAKPPHDFDFVTLLIGVNNQYQGKSVSEYEPEFQELLRMAIDFAGGKKERVLVVSIPDYGFTPFGKENQGKISREIDAFNASNRRIAEQLGVHYVNITDISRRGFAEPDLVAQDGLHPSGKMYAEWVERILREVDFK